MNREPTPEIDNEIYNNSAESWWSDNGFGAMLRHMSNPWRVSYFQRVFASLLHDVHGKKLLDIGCGGGILAEEFSAMGFAVTGIDPSVATLEVARRHAAESGLAIEYHAGSGMELAFDSETFDVVACCDVLEHIRDWRTAIGEIARVLKPGGVFIYDTINRTVISKLILINLAQKWKLTRFMPENLHTWDMFIKPEELRRSFERHGLQPKEIKGVKPAGNLLRFIMSVRQYNAGKLSAKELGARVGLREGPDTTGFYMGYAVKQG